MTFLIETKQREPIHDFTWELIQAKAYSQPLPSKDGSILEHLS